MRTQQVISKNESFCLLTYLTRIYILKWLVFFERRHMFGYKIPYTHLINYSLLIISDVIHWLLLIAPKDQSSESPTYATSHSRKAAM